MEGNQLINTLLLADCDEVINSFKGALDSASNLLISKTTDGAIEYISSSPIEVIISTPDFASSSGLHFFEEIMPEYPDPVRIMITEKDDLDSVIEAINKGRIYKYIVRPWSATQVATVVGEVSDLYHLRTDLESKVFNYNEHLIQAEMNLESLIIDIQDSDKIDSLSKFDFITRLKSTISLLGSPD